MANALFRVRQRIKTHRQQIPKVAILQLNIEDLTASKMSVLYHLAAQHDAHVILLQETHRTEVSSTGQPTGWVLLKKEAWSCYVYPRTIAVGPF